MKIPAFLISVCFLPTLFFLPNLQAQSEADQTLSPYFLVDGEKGFALKGTSAKVQIAGSIADVLISQEYVNETGGPIEATYVFPASTRAAVYDLEMVIGERVVRAEIMERQKARKRYEKAKAQGKRSSLLEQQRPNVFQMNVANIMPGETIEVKLRYTELLLPEAGTYHFVYPTVVGPRYTEETTLTASSRDQFTAMPYTEAKAAPMYDFDIEVDISAGMAIQDIHCSSHEVEVAYDELQRASIRLKADEKKEGNRDFLLHYCLTDKQVASGILLYEGEEENYFMMMVQPPERVETDQIPPREYIFVMDVSGSMNGFPLDISKKLMRNLILGLRPSDRFNVLLFAGSSGLLSEESMAATPGNAEYAISAIDRQRGGGGTRLLPALQEAYALPRPSENLSRSLVIITDGYVSVEREAFELVRRNLHQGNVFAFGIGRSVNRHLIEGLAHVGQGEPLVITQPEEAAEKAESFRKYIQTPVLTQVKADFGDFEVYDLLQQSIPDVLAERPILLMGKYRGMPRGTVTVKGRTAEGRYTEKLPVAAANRGPQNRAVRMLWAREKIRLIDDFSGWGNAEKQQAEVTALGLKYRLMTAYTSFVAVDKKRVRGKEEELTQVKQALPMPEGVSNYAIGFEAGVEEVAPYREKSSQAPPGSWRLQVQAPSREQQFQEAAEKQMNPLLSCLPQEQVNAVEVRLKVNARGEVVEVRLLKDGGLSQVRRHCLRALLLQWSFEVEKMTAPFFVMIEMKKA